MVSLKSILLVVFCGTSYAVPFAPNYAVESMSLPDPSRSGLETRGIESGTFIIKWIHALDNSKDLTFRAAIIYLQGQVFAPSGSGVYARF
ncbi:predicted protein [Pyrenophora tritici-repentis Pt-1C-BFP]|uniref:Uncharacterized protein n=1 Tax=Pyrenophora tritici-repentis (strain Pt-1C-BFP) TaxID=426418 RepID=B2VYG6_PYRTR|nr:uncharacterized protein PTRG_02456 [Pyrenophora tritici-repentis Pt-1C-BFP]EDU44979.1 predicted protein [Pyrenophora tritici-repentis Pt-1C-BFP]